MPPLVSVVIPTTGRRESLNGAVASALACDDGKNHPVEVLVVLNGALVPKGEFILAPSLAQDPRVAIRRIAIANGNAARNEGVRCAKGKYIRFLDDDDTLLPSGCQAQLKLAEHTSAGVCSAPIELVDGLGRTFGVARQPETPDFVAASMVAHRMLQCTAHLFNAELIKPVPWNESLAFSQDIEWVLRLCGSNEISWAKSDFPCGRWRRDTQNRISTSAPLSARKRIIAESILALSARLESGNRMSAHRRVSAASGLWDCIRTAMAFSPAYWTRIGFAAQRIAPGSSPVNAIHRSLLSMIGISPIVIEQLLIPKRLFDYSIKRLALAARLLPHW
jgi:hypothetical protein